MAETATLAALTAGLVLSALGAGAAQAQTSLSVYADGRVVVRRALPQALEKGRNTVVLKEALDPATVFSPDTTVALVTAQARGATTQEEALFRARGRTLAFAREKDTVRAAVVSVEPPQYRLPDGRFLLSPPGTPLFPAELVQSQAEVTLTLEASRARPRTDIAYSTEGASWEAVYQVVLTGAGCQVSGAATIRSQSLRFDSAEVQLVAGSIARARAQQQRLRGMIMAQAVPAPVEESESASEQAVGETHVYRLPGRLTLEPGVPVTTALFPRASTSYLQAFVVPGVLPWRGFFGAAPAEPHRVPVQVWYTLKRGRGTPFGDRPLPAGTVQLYQADSAGRLQLVGEAGSDHSAPGRDVRVQSGDAFDVTAERLQTDYAQEPIAPPRRGMPARQRVTAAYRVTIVSAKAAPVTVDVREARFGVWRVVESSIPPEKLSATEVRFRVPVPANGEATLTYTVQAET
jgi:hypothetical protein